MIKYAAIHQKSCVKFAKTIRRHTVSQRIAIISLIPQLKTTGNAIDAYGEHTGKRTHSCVQEHISKIMNVNTIQIIKVSVAPITETSNFQNNC